MARSDNRNCQQDTHDFADYAQEFLRRNRQYQRQFARLVGTRGSVEESSAARRMARTWGLEFSCRSRFCVLLRASNLALRLQRFRRHCDRAIPSLAEACASAN